MDSSLYIHIPFCISKCAYCDFFSKPYEKVRDEYIEALCNEIEYRINDFHVTGLRTIYIGGGTPSILSENQFNRIFDKIKTCTKLSKDAEITVEMNPDDVSAGLLKCLEDNGVTRISCGIQSMSDTALKRACRRASAEINNKALEIIKGNWQGDVSLDLISGLPGETEKSFRQGLQLICDFKAQHISLYSLTIEDKTSFGRQLSSGELVYDFDAADKLWLSGRDYLESRGYIWYEVSNFCLPGKECKHNLVYWNHDDYLGCGSSATGTVYNKDGSGVRWTNTVDIEGYEKWWGAEISENTGAVENTVYAPPESTVAAPPENTVAAPPQNSEIIDLATSQFEFFMMGLRKICGVSEVEFQTRFGRPLPETFIKSFERWEKKGLCLRREDGRYCMSREGMLFLNRFLEELC